MNTAYDWVTVLIFAVLVTRYLHHSAREEESRDKVWNYLVPAIGCAGANWLGNHGFHVFAVGLISATLCYIVACLLSERGGASGQD